MNNILNERLGLAHLAGPGRDFIRPWPEAANPCRRDQHFDTLKKHLHSQVFQRPPQPPVQQHPLPLEFPITDDRVWLTLQAMATTETRPPPTTLTSEHDPDQPSSGFTPVNGRSPPSLANGAGRSQGSPHSHHGTSNHLNGNTLLSKVNSDYAQQNTTSHIGRKDSDSSNKRRRPASDDDEDADDSTSSASSSKRRTSAQQTRPGAQPSTSNGQNAEPPYTAQRPTTNTNQPHYAGPGDPQWSQRSSHDEHTSEARLMEALAADPHHTSHHMGSMSDSPPEEYHQGNPQHLQHGPAHMQAPMQGAPPMTAAQSMQKQRKRYG